MGPLLPGGWGITPFSDELLLLSGSKMAELRCASMQAGGVGLTDAEASMTVPGMQSDLRSHAGRPGLLGLWPQRHPQIASFDKFARVCICW